MTVAAPKTIAHLEALRGLVTGATPPPPIAQLIGFVARRVDLGAAVMELDASGRHANPMGTLHGGVICDVADAALGISFATTLEDDETFTTLDLTTKYFKPIWNARLTFSAQVVKRTRTLGLIECDVTDETGSLVAGLIECDVTDETGSLVARVYSSCMVLRGADARGR